MVNEWMFHFVRNCLRLPTGVMVRKIHFDGIENFTKDVPVLLACNHPNSFFDGVIFEHISGRRVYTLARGDAFLKPKPNYMLRSMRILPIFRARDADTKTARSGNARTMDELYERFKLKHGILIFTEGSAYPEKAIRPLKNGTAGIAIEMAKRSDFTMDLHIVPTALNYTSFWPHIQKTVHVTYEKPIPILEYVEMIKNDEKGFTQMLNSKIQVNFDRNVVITKGDFTAEKEFLHEVIVNENYETAAFKINERWKLSVHKINQMNADFAEKVNTYMADLKKHKVLDSNAGNRGFDYLSALLAIVTMGWSLPIYFIWLLLFKLNDRFVHRKFKNIVFRDAVKALVGMLQGSGLVIGVAITAAVLTPSYWWLLFTISGIYGAMCWFRTIEAFPHLWSELQWLGLSDNVKKEITKKREAIIDGLSNSL